MKYRSEIDGLRALAVVPVILFHAGFTLFSGGFVGVDVFFVISGYLITTLIITEKEQGKFRLFNFYERRARRILPALFFVVLICLPFAWLWLTPNDMKGFAESLIGVATFSSNILFWRESGYFDTEAELKPFLHTWSLAVEEQYYILFPLFLMLFWRFGTKAIILSLAIVFGVSLGTAQWGAYNQPVAAFFLLPTRGWELLIGAFCAFYLTRHSKNEFGFAGHILGLSGLALIVIAIFTFDASTPMPSVYALIPTLGAALIILFAREGTIAQNLLATKYLVALGLISYSVYLWHYPMFAFLRYKVSNPTNTQFISLTILAFLLAYVSWKFIERPFRSNLYLSGRAIFKLSSVSILVLTTLGAFGLLNEGNYFRWSSPLVALENQVDTWNNYVWDYKNSIKNRNFTDSDRVKILVVGDSNSGDLLNALRYAYETKNVEFSSLDIRAGCGNLFLPENRFVSQRDHSQADCAGDKLLSENSLWLLEEADIVIFASSWERWETKLLRDSNNELVERFGDKFWYFGVKDNQFEFGDAIELAKTNIKVGKISSPPTQRALIINSSIHQAVGERFVDPFDLLCSSGLCHNVDDAGNFIFYDGFHLSPLGAQRLAARLLAKNTFNIVHNEDLAKSLTMK